MFHPPSTLRFAFSVHSLPIGACSSHLLSAETIQRKSYNHDRQTNNNQEKVPRRLHQIRHTIPHIDIHTSLHRNTNLVVEGNKE